MHTIIAMGMGIVIKGGRRRRMLGMVEKDCVKLIVWYTNECHLPSMRESSTTHSVYS